MDAQPLLANKEEHKNYQTNLSYTPQGPLSTTPTYYTLPNGQVQMVVTLPPSSLSSPLSPLSSPISSFPFQLYPGPPSAYQFPSPQSYGIAPRPPALSSSLPSSPSSFKRIKVAMLLTYLFGLFTFIPHFVSIMLTLHLLRRGQIIKKATTTIVFSVIELIAFTACLSLSWYFKENCKVLLKFNYDWYNYPFVRECHMTYYGWIAIVLWAGVAIIFGIPRIIYSWKGYDENNNNENNNSINDTVPLAFQANQSERASLGLRATIITSYILGFFTFFPAIISPFLSLLLLQRGKSVKESTCIIASSILEIFTWTVGVSLAWFPYDNKCEYVNNNQDDYECQQVWMGYIFIMPWWAVTLIFGIPRVILSWRN